MSHIKCGGVRPPNFTVKARTGALPAPAWEGRQGAEAAPVSRSTAAPLPPANTFPRWPGTSDADDFLPDIQKQCVHPEVPTATLPGLYGNPPPKPPRTHLHNMVTPPFMATSTHTDTAAASSVETNFLSELKCESGLRGGGLGLGLGRDPCTVLHNCQTQSVGRVLKGPLRVHEARCPPLLPSR